MTDTVTATVTERDYEYREIHRVQVKVDPPQVRAIESKGTGRKAWGDYSVQTATLTWKRSGPDEPWRMLIKLYGYRINNDGKVSLRKWDETVYRDPDDWRGGIDSTPDWLTDVMLQERPT